METYDADLLDAALRLLERRPGRRGRLPAAMIRRSVSTSYYALFHFLIDQAAQGVLGARGDLRARRRVLARTLSHSGVKAALDKVRASTAHASAADLLSPGGASGGPAPVPAFARSLADVFADAQAERHDADYNLNKPASAQDALALRARIAQAIAAWRAASSLTDRDFKQALYVLMLLRGRLRPE